MPDQYPCDYFVLSTGNIPLETQLLEKRWGYRMTRQVTGAGCIHVVSFDKDKMIQEMVDLRDSLCDLTVVNVMLRRKKLLARYVSSL